MLLEIRYTEDKYCKISLHTWTLKSQTHGKSGCCQSLGQGKNRDMLAKRYKLSVIRISSGAEDLYSLVVGCMASMCKALGSIPTTISQSINQSVNVCGNFMYNTVAIVILYCIPESW